MKQSKFKQLIASLLLGAMLVGGTSALAFREQGVGDDPPYPYFTDEVRQTVPSTAKSAKYATQYNPKKSRVTGVKVLWYADSDTLPASVDSSVLHIDWNAKKSVRKYEVQLGLNQKFSFSEYLTAAKRNSVTLRASTSTIFKPLLRRADDNTYYIRVRALYKKGKPGKWSKVVTLTPTEENQMTLNDYRRICNINTWK